MDKEVERQHLEEVERRLKLMREGKMETYPADEVFDKIRRKLLANRKLSTL